MHHPAMKFTEVPAFVAELREISEVSAAALQFLILTAARTGEVIGAKWPEIIWDDRTWTIPAARAKAGRVHVVPLSTGAMAVLQEMLPLRDIGHGFIFPGRNGGLSQMTLLALLQRRMKRHVTCHGFRSSFRDWCGDVADVPRELAEAALAHVLPDATERAYRRGTALEKRRELMQEWSNFCLEPEPPGQPRQSKQLKQLKIKTVGTADAAGGHAETQSAARAAEFTRTTLRPSSTTRNAHSR